jgi:hypothetical protein
LLLGHSEDGPRDGRLHELASNRGKQIHV